MAKTRHSAPRLHHIVPASLLAFFATPPTKKGRIFVWDKKRHSWPSTPLKACRERDYYRMDGSGNDPSTAEDALQEIENAALPVLRRIGQEGRLADDESFDMVILFMAMLEARGHGIRRIMERFVDDLGHKMLQMTAAHEEVWNAAVAKAIKGGFEPKRVPLRGDFFRMVQEKQIRVRAPQNMKLNWIAYALQSLFPLFRERHWVLVKADERTRVRFILADRPVVLAWSTPQPPSPYGIGYGFAGTDVTLPIGPSMMLLGRFEDEPSPIATDAYVATINSRAVNRSVRNLFSPQKEFVIWTDRGFAPITSPARASTATKPK